MKLLTRDRIRALSAEAAASVRRRKNLNLHTELTDPVQRLCNAFEPGTYVRPHRHPDANRWELFVALTGSAVVLTFEDDGTVCERLILSAAGPSIGVEIPAGTWHTLASGAAGTVLFEVKPGPYEPLTDKDFARWAPAEGDPRCPAFERWYREARPGDRPPPL
jgi:cupin fold WbuC family metalloprotein